MLSNSAFAMRLTVLAFCATLLGIAPLAQEVVDGAAGIGDTYYATMGNGGYDIARTRLELSVDMSTNELAGRAVHSARAQQALRSFHLDLADFLTVTEVQVDGVAASFEQEGDELIVRPAAALSADADFEIAVTYGGICKGVLDPAVQFGGPEPMRIGWVPTEKGVFTLSQPSGAASFFPCNDHPLDKAQYELVVTVAEPWTVAANGRLESVEELDGVRRFTFQPRDAMASYLVTVNIAEFDLHRQEGPGGLPLNYYIPSGADADEVLSEAAATGEMIEFFSELFGPYPFESYGAVVAPVPLPGALETQTLPVYGPRSFREDVIAHELAHQWFGNNVAVSDWRDIWLSEGFAVYAGALWTEHSQGVEAFETELRSRYQMLDRYDIPGPADPGVENLFGGAVYVRGGWVLHGLRLSVGDEAFFRSLRAYHRRFGGGNATTADFQDVLEECSGRELDAVFDAWLRSESLPAVPAMELAPTDGE